MIEGIGEKEGGGGDTLYILHSSCLVVYLVRRASYL